jgi:hypothetical protein
MRTGTITVGDLTFQVNIIGERTVFGRVELLITPVSGSGEKWTWSVNVKEGKDGPDANYKAIY